MTQPQSLVATVLRERYCRDGNFLEENVKGYNSLFWKSLLAAKDTLNLGLRWRVGNEKNIKIWDDKWLPTLISFEVHSPAKLLPDYATLSELRLGNGGNWNLNLLSTILRKEEKETICDIPLGKNNQEDKLIWAHTENDKFSFKSVYFAAVESKANNVGVSSTVKSSKLKGIWSLSVSRKVQNFL